MSKQKIAYKLGDSPLTRLSLQDRILLFMFRQDRFNGRTGQESDRYEILCEHFFRFSSAFLHFTDSLFCNTVYWDELSEYHSLENPHEELAPLPPHFIALARPIAARRREFTRQLVKLISAELIYAFKYSFRALAALASRKVPLLELWNSDNRDKPKEIIAVSLRAIGVQKARELDLRHEQICHWELPRAIVSDRQFGEAFAGTRTAH